jgi:hypothetical protein
LSRAHERKAEVAKAAAKKWKAEVAEAVDANRRPPDMPVEAMEVGEFIRPRLYCSDITIERLSVLLQARPSGISVVCDELAGLFLNMGRYSGGSDREFWLKAWNGGDHIVERQGRPAVVLDHLLVSITGGLQPEKLAKSFAGDDDGMYARFLFAWPVEPEYQQLSNDFAEVEPEFQNTLSRLAGLSTHSDETFAQKDIWLANDAVAKFEEFRHSLHDARRAKDGHEREWMAKGPGQVLRLAGTLALLDWAASSDAEPDHIHAQYIKSAIVLWRDYFLPHARAALRQIGLVDRHANARRLMRWVQANDKRRISVLDARRDALSHKLDAEQTQALIGSLVKANWLRDSTEHTGGRGRPVRQWDVNPELWRQVTRDAGNAGNAGNAH